MDAPFHADVADAPEGARARWLTTSDGRRLRAVFWAGGGRGVALIFPGRTEYAEKYGRVVRALAARGFGVAIVDWRGQGLSDRHAGRTTLGHVVDFAEFQRDVAAFVGAPELAAMPGPRLLVCHSMGGCIGLRTLLDGGDFAGAVFSSPMWGLPMPRSTRAFAGALTRSARVLGLGARQMPGTRRHGPPDPAAFEANALTSDAAQFAWSMGQLTAHPDLALGPPSISWLGAALREMARLETMPMPPVPLLGFVGDAESVVSTATVARRFAAAPDGEMLTCPGGRHELFLETAAIQAPMWQAFDRFLARVAP